MPSTQLENGSTVDSICNCSRQWTRLTPRIRTLRTSFKPYLAHSVPSDTLRMHNCLIKPRIRPVNDVPTLSTHTESDLIKSVHCMQESEFQTNT